jgi:hypothetical protein
MASVTASTLYPWKVRYKYLREYLYYSCNVLSQDSTRHISMVRNVCEEVVHIVFWTSYSTPKMH